jgi:hypothetical protein
MCYFQNLMDSSLRGCLVSGAEPNDEAIYKNKHRNRIASPYDGIIDVINI